MKSWFLDNRKRISNDLFYLALTIELILMIVEKSEIPFSLESFVFRATFLLTALAALLIKRNTKEWISAAAFLGLMACAYVISGKNDLLRVALFLMAARDVDLKKTMKYAFYVCLTGFIAIALLSVTGILGDVLIVGDFGRGIPDEKRYVFGFGHPNTLFGSSYAILMMWLWLYGAKAGILSYIAVSAGSVLIAVITRSRTGLAVVMLTLVLAAAVRLFPKLREKRFVYIISALISPTVCVLLSVLAAGFTGYWYTGKGIPSPEFYWDIEPLLSYRMSNIYYSSEDRGGVLARWKLFAPRTAEGYFDMGWVRLFYWYGIIPALVIIVLLFIIIYMCCKKKDIWTMVLILSIGIYTVVEATFVTRYIGRDFFLIIAAVYLGEFFGNKFKAGTKEGNIHV